MTNDVDSKKVSLAKNWDYRLNFGDLSLSILALIA